MIYIHCYQKTSVKWSRDLESGSFAGYEGFGENVLKYSRDGAVYLNKKGEAVWNQAYEMTAPFASVSGNYAVVADKKGYSLYICNQDGCRGVVTTTLPISRAAVSSTGVTVAILEDTKSNVIAFYDKTGTKLEIEIQTTLSGNGYPMDLAISPNGMLLMVSYVYLDAGSMQNQVVFYNFDEEGQSIRDRLVGGFKEYGSSMVARVHFLDDTHAAAFAQDRLCFYSLENTVKPVQTAQVDIDADTEIRRNRVLFYRDSECRIYNLSGKLKYRGTMEGSIEKLICLGENRYIQIGPQAMMELELK